MQLLTLTSIMLMFITYEFNVCLESFAGVGELKLTLGNTLSSVIFLVSVELIFPALSLTVTLIKYETSSFLRFVKFTNKFCVVKLDSLYSLIMLVPFHR